jgi:hypothetical protein
VAVQDNNQAPDAVDDMFTVAEDSTATPLDVLANDTDPNAGDTLTITAVGETSGDGTVTIAPDNKGLIYTPAANASGSETFTYTISDGRGGTDTATVTVTVTAVTHNGRRHPADDHSRFVTDQRYRRRKRHSIGDCRWQRDEGHCLANRWIDHVYARCQLQRHGDV